jgi:hypothetical protein
MDKVYDVFNGYYDDGIDGEELEKIFSEAADSVCPASWTVIPTTEAKTTEEPSTATGESSSAERGSSTGASSAGEPTETGDSEEGAFQLSFSTAFTLGLTIAACLANMV